MGKEIKKFNFKDQVKTAKVHSFDREFCRLDKGRKVKLKINFECGDTIQISKSNKMKLR